MVIKDKAGNVLGAAGASGGTGDEDEAVCIAGVEAAGLMIGLAGRSVIRSAGLAPLMHAAAGPR